MRFRVAVVLSLAMIVVASCSAPPGDDNEEREPSWVPPGVIPSFPRDEIVSDDDRACARDDDCVVVFSSCNTCACWDGAKTAVNTSAVDVVAQRLDETCSGACQLALSGDETCCATGALCSNDRCELTGPRGRSVGNDCAEEPTN